MQLLAGLREFAHACFGNDISRRSVSIAPTWRGAGPTDAEAVFQIDGRKAVEYPFHCVAFALKRRLGTEER